MHPNRLTIAQPGAILLGWLVCGVASASGAQAICLFPLLGLLALSPLLVAALWLSGAVLLGGGYLLGRWLSATCPSWVRLLLAGIGWMLAIHGASSMPSIVGADADWVRWGACRYPVEALGFIRGLLLQPMALVAGFSGGLVHAAVRAHDEAGRDR